MAVIYKIDRYGHYIETCVDATRNRRFYAIAHFEKDLFFVIRYDRTITDVISIYIARFREGTTPEYVKFLAYTPIATGVTNGGIAYDDEFVHVILTFFLMGWNNNYYKYDLDGTLVGQDLGVLGAYVGGMTFNDSDLWVIEGFADYIYQLDAKTTEVMNTVGTEISGYTTAGGLGWDGKHLLTTGGSMFTGYKIASLDLKGHAANQETFISLAQMKGMTYDGDFIYACI